LDRYRYDGYSDSAVSMDWMTEAAAERYIDAFLLLVECEASAGNDGEPEIVQERMKAAFMRSRYGATPSP
ncbi:MAG TPA: hypothetical protein VM118_08605, partial [Acidobacteriota bacterium]|nr:hypothetical protein [Acidobacteriota bacterium]